MGIPANDPRWKTAADSDSEGPHLHNIVNSWLAAMANYVNHKLTTPPERPMSIGMALKNMKEPERKAIMAISDARENLVEAGEQLLKVVDRVVDTKGKRW